MPPSESDRRRAPRRIPQGDEPLSRARLRTGRELAIINVSSAGALVEGLTRLLPGTRAEVHLVTRHGRVLVRTRVVRSFVWRLDADAVCYRTALAFDAAVDIDPALSEPTESKGLALSEPNESKGLALSERSESNGYALPGEILRNGEGQGSPYPGGAVEGGV
jgi:hypothetical protein